MCRPKEQGGLGIMDLETQNKCLLSKWLFKLINEEGIWQQMLRNKYLANKTITRGEKTWGFPVLVRANEGQKCFFTMGFFQGS